MEFTEEVLFNVRERRRELGMTQEEVAQKLGKLRQAYNSLEIGKDIKLSTLKKLADILKIDIIELITEQNETGDQISPNTNY